MYVIGVDPGPIPGVVRLHIDSWRVIEHDALQITPRLLTATLDMLTCYGEDPAALAVERFVVGRRAARSSTPTAGTVTRELVAIVAAWADHHGIHQETRSAAEVKPWATDTRLDAAGLLATTTGMRHARDAARHALFCAVRDFGLPDPLSHRGRGA